MVSLQFGQRNDRDFVRHCHITMHTNPVRTPVTRWFTAFCVMARSGIEIILQTKSLLLECKCDYLHWEPLLINPGRGGGKTLNEDTGKQEQTKSQDDCTLAVAFRKNQEMNHPVVVIAG